MRPVVPELMFHIFGETGNQELHFRKGSDKARRRHLSDASFIRASIQQTIQTNEPLLMTGFMQQLGFMSMLKVNWPLLS